MKDSLFAARCMIILLFVFSHSSISQIVWQRSPHNPVLRDTGEFLLALEPSVLYDSVHGRYDMWFTGKNETYNSSFAIYHARSTNGANWVIDSGGPALSPDPEGSYDSDVRGPSVIRDKEGYKMYFLAHGVGGHTFGVATSVDGVTWAKYSGNPIVMKGAGGTWESNGIAYPNVYFDGSKYFLWYGGSDGSTGSIGLATSTDGLTWIKYANNPVLKASAGGWDALGVGQPSVAQASGKFYMLYDATLTSYCCASRIGEVTSADGIHWTKYANNPVFVPGSTGSWDDEAVSTGSLVFRDGTFQFWYSALSASTGLWQTGYAMSRIASNHPMSGVDPRVVALWHFDEGSGNILHDASMYHNDGQIHNCRWVAGKFGSALHFDGLTSYVDLPNSPSLQLAGQFTIEVWFLLDTLQFGSVNSPGEGGATLLCNYGMPNGGGYGLGFWSGGKEHFNYRSHPSASFTTAEIPIPTAHVFHHIAVVYKTIVASGDSLTAVLTYLDGALRDSSAFRGGVQYLNTPKFYMGTEPAGRAVGSWAVREFPGIIDEIRISNVALEPSEFDMPHIKSMEAKKSKTGGSNDVFSVRLAPRQTKIVLNGKVGIINTGNSGPSRSRLRLKGIFGLARGSGGPFEEGSIAVTTGDDFFVQVSSGLYYEVFVKRESRQGVTLKFSRMLKKK